MLNVPVFKGPGLIAGWVAVPHNLRSTGRVFLNTERDVEAGDSGNIVEDAVSALLGWLSPTELAEGELVKPVVVLALHAAGALADAAAGGSSVAALASPNTAADPAMRDASSPGLAGLEHVAAIRGLDCLEVFHVLEVVFSKRRPESLFAIILDKDVISRFCGGAESDKPDSNSKEVEDLHFG